MADSETTALREQVRVLETRLNEMQASSWLVSPTLWRRVLAVMGHIIVGYFATILVAGVVGLMITAISSR